ncbi:MAG: glycosyltransferase [Magnetococcus sp. XQGC-1]
METLLANLFRLEAEGDIVGINRFVVENRYNAPKVFKALQYGFVTGRLRLAYILALILDSGGFRHFLISLGISAGGIFYGKEAEERRGREMLYQQAASLSAAEQRLLHNTLSPVIAGLLVDMTNTALVVRIIEMVKAAVPTFRAIFDWHAPVPRLAWEKMRQRGREQAHLIDPPQPPADALRVKRRVLIMIRQQRGNGLRFASAMNSYGWDAEVSPLPLSDATAAEDCRLIAEMCRQKKTDLLFFDANQLVTFARGMAAYREMTAQLRQENPGFRALGLFFDQSPDAKQSTLEIMRETFDGVVSQLPLDSFIRRNPAFKVFDNRTMLHSFASPVGDQNLGKADQPLVPHLFFSGTICSGHWPRALWLGAIAHMGLPQKARVNAFSYDNPLFKQSPLDDYSAYVRGLAEATCCFSPLMLEGENRYLTGRTFEVPLCGALLVQEASPLTHYYFIPGEHFLEFSTISELVGVMQFIKEHREEAEEIRRCGNAFARERYNDARMVAHFDHFLYYADRDRAAGG